jgi:NADH-quinone oxidoreductase subunit H
MSAGFYFAAKLPDDVTAVRLAGTLHAIADTIKMVWKEDLRPKNADKVLFSLAPLLAMIPAMVTAAVLPFGRTLCFHDVDKNLELNFGDLTALANTVGRTGECAAGQLAVNLQVADLNVGLLFVFGIAGTGIIGAAIAGWASDSKLALLGGLRATSQMISYEVAMGLAIVGLLMVVGSVHMGKIVEWQGNNTWGIFAQPLGFVLFFTAVIAETKRIPFDQPEGESEIVAGYFLEYSGMKWGMFMVGEYIEFIFSSALMVTLFLGGYNLPFLHADGITVAFGDSTLFALPMSHAAVSVIQVITFFTKTILFAWFHIFIRWTLPRFRYDQLMKLGWTKLLPLALLNIMLTGLVLLAIDSGSENVVAAVDMAAAATQMLVAVGGLVAIVAIVTWLLEPPTRRRVVQSSSARFASAAGGVKVTEMTP